MRGNKRKGGQTKEEGREREGAVRGEDRTSSERRVYRSIGSGGDL